MHRETAEKSELKRLKIECNKKKMKKKKKKRNKRTRIKRDFERGFWGLICGDERKKRKR